MRGRRQPHDLPQPPPDPVAFDRVADLLGNGETDAHRSVLAPRHASAAQTSGTGPWRRPRRPGSPRVVSAAPWRCRALPHGLGGQPLASARAAGADDLAAARGLHAGAITVTAFAHELAGLIGPLHRFCSPFAVACGLIRSPAGAVNATLPAGWAVHVLPQKSVRWLRLGGRWCIDRGRRSNAGHLGLTVQHCRPEHARRTTATRPTPARAGSGFAGSFRSRSSWRWPPGPGDGLAPRNVAGKPGPLSHRARRLHRRAWLAAVAAFVALYIAVVALSIPGALFLTITGGFLFGTFVGRRRRDFRRERRRDADLSDRPDGVRRIPVAARRPARGEARRRLPRRRVQLSAVPAAGAVSVFHRQPGRGAGRRSAGTFVAATALGIIPATFAFASFGAGLDSVIAAQEAAYRTCLAAGGANCRLDFDLKAAITPQLIGALVALGVLALIPVAVQAAARAARRASSVEPTDGRAVDPRSLRHRRRLRRPVGRRRRRGAWRAGGADRERPRWAASASTPAACRRRR